ncbi:MAG: ADP-glyceromanno-heptose 6-epimerase [Phycisphaera sp.]|nr:ADP-glyceromanno-heptose 6-epimerase [Phycisphaera sp.]
MMIVTGANGFIAAYLVAYLAKRGAGELFVVDDFPSIRDKVSSSQAPAEVRHDFPDAVKGYADLSRIGEVLAGQAGRFTGIYHLGACSDTTATDRQYIMANNLEYTRTLWRWCTEHGKPFVYASSAATYGDGSNGYDDRKDPHRYKPLNLYGESKQLFDLWALEQKEAPPRWAGVKYFNVFGPGESHKGRMASVAFHTYNKIKETGGMKLFKSHLPGVADGEQKRDFIHVADAVAATVHLMKTPVTATAPNGLYNIGTGLARTFKDLATAVFTAQGLEPKIEYIPMPEDLRGKYQYFTQATTEKLARSGFAYPMRSLEQGVKEYVDYLGQSEQDRRRLPG